jgi:hypothetical protein
MPRGTYAHNLFLLEGSEEFDLRLKRHFTYFVQEDRTAVGCLEEPTLVRGGASEGTLFVTEKNGFCERVWHCSAVEWNEGTVPSFRILLDGAGY